MSLEVGIYFRSFVNVRDYIYMGEGAGGTLPGVWVAPHVHTLDYSYDLTDNYSIHKQHTKTRDLKTTGIQCLNTHCFCM